MAQQAEISAMAISTQAFSTASRMPAHQVDDDYPFNLKLGPSAPRSARRSAPFVVLVGLVMYAAVVFTALTAPATAQGGKSGESTRGSDRSMTQVDSRFHPNSR